MVCVKKVIKIHRLTISYHTIFCCFSKYITCGLSVLYRNAADMKWSFLTHKSPLISQSLQKAMCGGAPMCMCQQVCVCVSMCKERHTFLKKKTRTVLWMCLDVVQVGLTIKTIYYSPNGANHSGTRKFGGNHSMLKFKLLSANQINERLRILLTKCSNRK